MTLDDLLAQGVPPIAAILRGVSPNEAVDVAGALVEAGIRIIEVPFNSPDPLDSIRAIQAAFGDRALVGGGTVLDVPAVEDLARSGGRIMVTPNIHPPIIARGVALGLDVLPGFVTPTEAFAAIAAGARRLKLFPAANLGPGYLKAVREVLPRGTGIWAVGGTNAETFADWLAAGAEGIGVGGALFRPGDHRNDVANRGRALVSAWHAAERDRK